MHTTLFAAIMAGTVLAADRPDYSGRWKINFEKSDFGPLGAPRSYTMRIDHWGDSLNVEFRQTGVIEYFSNVPYRTDGSVVSYQASGMAMKGKAIWDGDAIITNSVSETGDTVRNRMTLSADGRTLTSRVSAGTAIGSIEFVYVFDKA